jgi:uncharacterized protein
MSNVPLNRPQDEQKAWLGRGWAYPVTFDPVKGTVAESEYEADIRQAIIIILSTSRGERVMRPDFGCGIYDLVFDVVDTALLTRIDSEVRESMIKFEARIELTGVDVNPRDALDGKLLIEMEYRIRRTNQSRNLVFPFYFREGGTGAAEEFRG